MSGHLRFLDELPSFKRVSKLDLIHSSKNLQVISDRRWDSGGYNYNVMCNAASGIEDDECKKDLFRAFVRMDALRRESCFQAKARGTFRSRC